MNMKLKPCGGRFALPIVAVAVATSGCAHQTARRAHSNRYLTEESKALTTAVVETLSTQPVERRDAHTATALTLARQDQRLEGLPLQAIHVEPLISSNAAATAALARRFALEDEVLARRQDAEDRLISLGQRKEGEIRAQRLRWLKWGGGITTLLAAFVALCIFCPLVIPILGRLLGWVVGRLPSWAGAFGVVSLKAFDAVVRGVERTRKTTANTADGAGAIANLDMNLSVEMDEAHKALVRSRKEVLHT